MCIYTEEIVRIVNIAQQISVHGNESQSNVKNIVKSEYCLDPINFHCVDNSLKKSLNK